MVTLVNRAYVGTATTGTGTITLGAAEAGYQTFAAAGVTNGDVVPYVIVDGNNWEIGTGTYSSTGPTLTRTPSESSSAGAAINLSGNAKVFVTARAADIVPTSGGAFSGNVDFGAGIDVTGNVTVTGTVDGRDVAADGSKLDGIEAGADVTDAGNVNPLVDAHLNTSTATAGQALTWSGSDYEWSTTGPINDVFYENSTTVTANYTITSGKNAVTAGPVTIASGVTVTVPSGSRWAVV